MQTQPSIGNFNQFDLACLNDIKNVLEKHNKIERFGVIKLQHHFDIDEDQMLLETHSKVERTLTIKPASQERLKEDNIIITNWRFDKETNNMQGCLTCCGACCFDDTKPLR
jgi:hypothetical protein